MPPLLPLHGLRNLQRVYLPLRSMDSPVMCRQAARATLPVTGGVIGAAAMFPAALEASPLPRRSRGEATLGPGVGLLLKIV